MAGKTEKLEKIEKVDKIQKVEKAEKLERPSNLRADVMPSDGYVLSVDGKLKTRFDSSDEAMTAAVKLKQSYPVIQVTVFDASARSYTPVVLPE